MNLALNCGLISRIRRILLNHFVAKLCTNYARCRSFPDARRSRNQGSSPIGILNVLPADAASKRKLLLVSTNANLIPIFEPLVKLTNGSCVSYQIGNLSRFVPVSPQIRPALLVFRVFSIFSTSPFSFFCFNNGCQVELFG